MSTSPTAPARLRVALDGRAFDAAAGGVRRYVTELTAALRERGDVDLIAVGGQTAPEGMRRQPASFSLPTNLGWCATGLPLALRHVACDVVHAPAYTGPLWGRHPLVLTIHDVSYARRPEWSPHPGGVGVLRRRFYETAARRATRIVTDSEFSRSEIVAAYGIASDRIDVVPLGVQARFTPDPRVSRERFVLHVGDIHPRRNLAMLLDVVLSLRRSDARLADLRLVLAGRDLGLLADLRARADSIGQPRVLEYLGQPTDADLVGWYRRAGVFAYPSRYEGFGLPVLEAMACGAPVVASNAASIPEVAGDAAVLLSPDDAAGWSQALETMLLDATRATEFAAHSQARAKQFTWSRTAALTRESYLRALIAREL